MISQNILNKFHACMAAFNAGDAESVRQKIPHEKAAEFLQTRIPMPDCPDATSQTLVVLSNVLDNWDHFCLENLWLKGKCFTITYDRNGTHCGKGPGLTIKGE